MAGKPRPSTPKETATTMIKRKRPAPAPDDDTPERASRHTLALNPLINLRPEDFVQGAKAILKAVAANPAIAGRQAGRFAGDLRKVIGGKSDKAPASGDKRFADKTWTASPLHRRLMQGYFAMGDAVGGFVEQTSLSDLDKSRAQLVTTMLIDAVAPTNGLLTNPAALRQALDTGGVSVWEGAKNFARDLAKNRGLPSQVDLTAFKVGENLANTPGAVVFKNQLIEVIQYGSLSETVKQRPLVIVPPQINKYYAVDLSPDKSMVRYLLSSGIQTFCVSWRNPTAAERDWGLDTYVAALDEAIDAVCEITGSPDVTLMGSCSGGITAASYAATLAARRQAKVKNIVLAVCVLNYQTMGDSTLGVLITPQTVAAAKKASSLRGVLDGHDLARMFAWMRPNDLIWNYWVNNYLMGNKPPAFDILYWNADTTRLPARLHADYLDFYFSNPFVNAGALTLNGAAVDMGKVEADSYVVAGVTDHITPWKSVFQTAKILGEKTTFILSNSGHLQSLLNPPTNPKASFSTGTIAHKDADQFLADAERRGGSWWLHWREWLETRSRETVAAPSRLGSDAHPATTPAPGTYVYEK
ncbi:alpha/beta fold hydrolase [Oleomonas cavernae]|uniref:Alpha/beta fold hydrolase n=2 Tax=Oleomonas cavernae TaxID=2320859 RepID=A0A418WE72_9PROT|nr:alpha/beta fold hydrolase [Oleomonas cavernae]